MGSILCTAGLGAGGHREAKVSEVQVYIKCLKSQVKVLFGVCWLKISGRPRFTKGKVMGQQSFILFLSCLTTTTVLICCFLGVPSQEELLGVELWQPQKHIALGQVEGDQDAQGTE